MKLRMALPLLAALALAACGAGTFAPSAGGGAATENAMAAATAAPAPMAAPPLSGEAMPAGGRSALDTKGSSGPAEASAQPQTDRLIVKHAQVSLQVDDVRRAETELRAKIAALGGYVVRAESSGDDRAMSVNITFRVPAARFDEALSGAQALAQKVLARTISGDDVTEEYIDLQSRLKNLQATRDRLQSFLDRAAKVEDALAVNNALTDVQGQIEQITGRMQYLRQSAALSSITVALLPVPVTPLVQEGGWQPLAVARGALASLLALAQNLANLAIVLLVWTPVWLPLVLLGRWLGRRLRGRAGPARA
jgi:hypothetical protein